MKMRLSQAEQNRQGVGVIMLCQVDVDSTLYDSDLLFQEVAKEFDVDWPLEYSYWFGPKEIGTDLKTLKNIFKRAHSKDYVMTTTPYPNAVEVLERLVATYEDIEIVYISDRNEQQGEALRSWLEREGFLTSEEQHVMATKDKRHWMREHRPEIVIDDRVRTLLFAAYELNSVGISLEHPYNVNLKGEIERVHIVDDWLEIGEVLDTVVPKIRKEVLV
jgi:hypothetical protein